MKIPVSPPQKLSVRQDLNRAVLTYLEGDVLLKSQINLILKKFPPVLSKTPLYRTLRSSSSGSGKPQAIEFKSAFCSASMTPHTSLFAAISYAHDMDKACKYFVVYEFHTLEILIDHRALVELAHKAGKPYQMRRTLNEREVLVLGHKTFVGKSVVSVSGRFANHKNWHRVDTPDKVLALLDSK